MTLEYEKMVYKKIIKKYNVTHFIQHPRQKTRKIDDYSIIELKSNKIAEELILDISNQYDIVVLGIFSTVLLNLSSQDNIKLINIEERVQKPVCRLIDLFTKLDIESVRND
jgi:hypothetical protein